MNVGASATPLLRFGIFELDLRSGELRKNGAPIKLQPQPFKVLALLAKHAGQLVTREEIRGQIWSHDTFVDFEQGLNYCIRKIRAALGDDVGSPRYIETLQRRGYRLIVPVEELSGRQAPSGGARVMLAVLPFENLSGNEEQEYFSDGLTDEMITQLGRLNPERLGVIARTSAMKYKHTGKSIQQIGRELGVYYVLEGSVRRAGNRVRIAAQLIQVSDQTHLWAESYERDLGDILGLQSDVAQAIGDEIRVKLTPQEQARLASVRPVHPEAYEAYLKGRYFWNKRTKEALQKGVRYFERAIEKDPGYAVGYAGLADCYLRLLDYNYLSPHEASARANAAAVKALQIDETLADAHTSLGHLGLHGFNWQTAEKEFKRAIELNPGYGTAHFYYANLLAALGRHAEAIAEAKRAQELDPVAPSASLNAAVIFYLARQYEQAIEQAEKALEMDPNFAPVYYYLGLAYEQKGIYGKAIATFQKAIAPSGRGPGSMAALAHAYGVAGKRSEALKLLKELKDLSKRQYVSPYDFALLFLGLGEKDQAFVWLVKAYEERSSGLPFLKVDPRLDALHSHRRFIDLVRRMDFPE